VIIDTCVWIEHFKQQVPVVARLCKSGRAVVHADVLGEVMLGCGDEREEVVAELRLLPRLDRPAPPLIESLVERHAIACKRIGWVDAVILCTAVAEKSHPTVLTFDRKLLREAIRLGVAFAA